MHKLLKYRRVPLILKNNRLVQHFSTISDGNNNEISRVRVPRDLAKATDEVPIDLSKVQNLNDLTKEE